MLFGGIFEGKIFDYYGPRVLITTGTFLHVFGLMMTSISTKYYQILLSQSVCSGIGASMVFYPAFTCVRQALVISNTTFLIHSSGIDLFLQETRRCSRSCCSRVLARWRHLSNNGVPSHSGGRLRLDHANLCFHDPSYAYLRKSDRPLPHFSYKDAVRGNGFHPTVERTYLRSLDRCYIFLLL